MRPRRAISKPCRLSEPPATPWRSLQRASAANRASPAPTVSQPSPSRAGTEQGDVMAKTGLLLAAAAAIDKPASSKAEIHRTDPRPSCGLAGGALGMAKACIATFGMFELARWNASRLSSAGPKRWPMAECELSSVLTTRVSRRDGCHGEQEPTCCFTTKKTCTSARPGHHRHDLRGHSSDYRS